MVLTHILDTDHFFGGLLICCDDEQQKLNTNITYNFVIPVGLEVAMYISMIYDIPSTVIISHYPWLSMSFWL